MATIGVPHLMLAKFGVRKLRSFFQQPGRAGFVPGVSSIVCRRSKFDTSRRQSSGVME